MPPTTPIVAVTPTYLSSSTVTPIPPASTPTATLIPTIITLTPVPSATPTTYTFTRQRDALPTFLPTNSPTPTITSSPQPTATRSVTPSPLVQPTDTPLPLPSATPTPALSLDSWRGEYYDNPSLAGLPTLVRSDPNLDFNWLLDSPAPSIPADNFTVRWSRLFDFKEAGDYRFFADADDGVKLYVDGWLVIDEWNTDRPTVHSGVFSDIQPGIHTVVVEYFESGGYARIKVWGEKTTIVDDNWIGEYYATPDFKDPAFLIRQDSSIDFDWARGSPTAGLDSNNFSVRWHRTLYLESGDYRFRAEIAGDDQVKIFLDDWMVAEGYKEENGTVNGAFSRLGAGYHTLTVQYQEFTGRAKIKFSWEKE